MVHSCSGKNDWVPLKDVWLNVVEDVKPRGRPKTTWKEVIEPDSKHMNLSTYEAVGEISERI